MMKQSMIRIIRSKRSLATQTKYQSQQRTTAWRTSCRSQSIFLIPFETENVGSRCSSTSSASYHTSSSCETPPSPSLFFPWNEALIEPSALHHRRRPLSSVAVDGTSSTTSVLEVLSSEEPQLSSQADPEAVLLELNMSADDVWDCKFSFCCVKNAPSF